MVEAVIELNFKFSEYIWHSHSISLSLLWVYIIIWIHLHPYFTFLLQLVQNSPSFLTLLSRNQTSCSLHLLSGFWRLIKLLNAQVLQHCLRLSSCLIYHLSLELHHDWGRLHHWGELPLAHLSSIHPKAWIHLRLSVRHSLPVHIWILGHRHATILVHTVHFHWWRIVTHWGRRHLVRHLRHHLRSS